MLHVEHSGNAVGLRRIKVPFLFSDHDPGLKQQDWRPDCAAEPRPMDHGQHLVLVVDDDRAVRESLKFALELEGFNVHACDGGPDLMACPYLPQADCLVLDYHMPGMDGFAVLDALKARGLDIPVIFITGRVNDALRRRAAAAGVRHVVEKPLLDCTLIESINDVLEPAG